MKKLLYSLCIIPLLLTSCDFSSKVNEQLSFLIEMSKQFGGSWNGSTERGCYKIEITNSARLNNNIDSLDYFATIIGRKYINDLGLNYLCLKLELIDETKIAMFTSTKSNVYNFDLALIRRFNTRTIEEYLIIRKAIVASQNADNHNLIDAEDWLADIDTTLNNPFVDLAIAHIDRAKGNTQESSNRINGLVESNTTDDQLKQFIGIYFTNSNELNKALSMFKQAAKLNVNNNEHLINIGSIYYQMAKYDSSAIYYTKVIERDSLTINALYSRACCRFQENKNELGCTDIRRILIIEPEIILPDSILDKCGL